MKLEGKILKKLQPFSNKKRAEHDRGYTNTKLELLGCTMPQIRQVAREIVVYLPKSDANKRKSLHELWQQSKVFDVLHLPLIYFQSRKKKNNLVDWRTLKNFSEKIDNWAHSDCLSDSIATLLENYPDKIYPELKRWNKSNNSWQRRLSLTSLIYYAPQRKNPLPYSKIFPLVKNRLADTDPYVQKAVGWTLRETHKLYPEKTKKFVFDHANQLSAVAFSYATEKWSKQEKETLKKLRKYDRSKKEK